MAEVVLNNRADFTASYDGETIDFSSNTVATRILQGISAVKTANKEIWVNGALTYGVTLTNTSGETITSAVFTDTLDAAITLDQTTGVLVNGATAVYTYTGNVLTVNLPDLEEGETVTITFQVLQA